MQKHLSNYKEYEKVINLNRAQPQTASHFCLAALRSKKSLKI